MYKILFYRDKNGKQPVLEYMKDLSRKKDKNNTIKLNKINDYIQALSVYGTVIGAPYIITFPKCRYTNNGLRFYIPVTLIKLQGYSWFPHGNPLKISGFFLAWMHQYTSAAPSL